MACRLTIQQANEFLDQAFAARGDRGEIIEVGPGRAVARLQVGPSHLRPGGLVSGPTQMAMADMVSYMAIMTEAGVTPMAVTSNLNIHFLRPCQGDTVIAEGTIMKLGRTLAIVEVDIRVAQQAKPASHAVVTYALPK